MINKGQFKKGSSGFKGKHHTEITKQQQSETRLKRKMELGYLNSPETRQKLRIINSGENNPMFGVHKFGKDAPNYGKHPTEETRKNMSEGHKGLNLSEETKQKIREKLKGIPKTEEHKKNLSTSHKGKPTWNKDKICPQLSGYNNPNWQNGKSFEPYDVKFNKQFKNLVKLRDNFCCVNCGISEQNHLFTFGKKLPVHHIDYNKENTCLMNCCALCIRCNTLANKNREQWKLYYQEKLSKRCGYQYEENQNTLINLEAGTK